MIFARADFLGAHLLICSTRVLRWKSDDFRFELRLGIVLGRELQDTFLN